MSLLQLLAFFAIFISSLVECAQILAISQYPFYSHQQLHYTLFKELALRGHNLTIFTTHKFDYGGLPNVAQYHFNESELIHKKHVDLIKYKQNKVKWYQKLMSFEQKAFYEMALSEMKHPEMQKLIHQSENYKKFDLIIGECVMCSSMFLAEIYDCPIVFVTGIEPPQIIHALFGNDVTPSLYPDSIFLPFLHRHLTFAERIEAVMLYLFFVTMFSVDHKIRMRKMQKMYFSEMNDDLVTVLQRRSILMLTNTHPAFGHVRPLMPNTVQVGFMHVEPPRKIIDEKLLQFLDESKNGVIIVCFGSSADTKSLDQATVNKFLSVFNQTDLDVIWKSRENDMNLSKNVLLLEWLPLADVLAHPSVKLIIFHGGIFTAYEAIDRGVPMIVFPLAYDQGANARMLVHNEIAREFNINDFSESALLTAIEEMIKEKYKENVQQVKRLVYDTPMSSRNLAVWKIEHVLRNKEILKVSTAGYTEQFQRYLLDIIISTLVFVAVLRWMTRKAVGRLMSRDC